MWRMARREEEQMWGAHSLQAVTMKQNHSSLDQGGGTEVARGNPSQNRYAGDKLDKTC